MKTLKHIFDQNRQWAAETEKRRPGFFAQLVDQQTPKLLWIGCADSRVPADALTGLMPGQLFVHRNVANIVVPGDLNCLSVLQYAVEVLKVEHIIVCGHYGCGGVTAAMEDKPLGLIDQWLIHIKEIYHQHRQTLDAITDPAQRRDRLCELNVIQQVHHLNATDIVQKARQNGQILHIHGWIYCLADGLLRDLNVDDTPGNPGKPG